MAEFMFNPLAVGRADAAQWAALRASGFFLGVQLWLAVLALSRGILSLLLDVQFSRAHAERYEASTKEALFSLRVARALALRARLALARTALPTDGGWAGSEAGAPAQDLAAFRQPSEMHALDAPIDAELGNGAHKRSVKHRLALLIAALDERKSGTASSLAEAKAEAKAQFEALLADALPSERGDGPTILLSAIQGWVVDALRPRSAEGAARIAAKVSKMVSLELDQVAVDNFQLMAANTYKAQRNIKSSLETFSALNRTMAAAAVALWAFLLAIAGIALVDWGFDLEQWIVPFSSTFLAVAAILGRMPYEAIAGMLWVSIVQPYDIGDSCAIAAPGEREEVKMLVVSEIHPLSTTFIKWNGDQHTLWNWELRNLNVINYHRSAPPLWTVDVCLPTAVSAETLTSVMDFVREYAENVSKEWVTATAVIRTADYLEGTLLININLRSVFQRNEGGKLFRAASRFIIVLHSYLRALGVDFEEPAQAVSGVWSF